MPRTPLPIELDDCFRVRDGLALGASASRLRGADLSRPHRGIRSTQTVVTDADRARAFAPRLPERAFFMAVTAARIHGLPTPTGQSTARLDIGVRVGDARVHAAGIRSHHIRISNQDITFVDGVAITSPARTWCDLAALGLSLGQLAAVGDRLVWRRDPLTTLDDLVATLTRYDGRRGTRLMRAALPLLSDRSDSAPESEIRIAIIEAGLPHPLINAPVLDKHGRFVASPDLTWPWAKVAVEYEGDHHRTDRDQWHRDIDRVTRLQMLGWIVIRATAADYRDPSDLIRRLSQLLSSS